MKTVTDAFADWTPRHKTYEEWRYPYRYSWAFLVEHPELVPAEIHARITEEVMSKPNSKGEPRKRRHPADSMANLKLQAWLKETGEDEWAACTMLAEAHLEEHQIDAPEGRHQKRRLR